VYFTASFCLIKSLKFIEFVLDREWALDIMNDEQIWKIEKSIVLIKLRGITSRDETSAYMLYRYIEKSMKIIKKMRKLKI